MRLLITNLDSNGDLMNATSLFEPSTIAPTLGDHTNSNLPHRRMASRLNPERSLTI